MLDQVLFILLLFQIKHLCADFLLQTPYILNNRRIYGHPGGLLHVAHHLALSGVVLLVAGCDLRPLALLLLAEGIVHYHIDWSKDNIVTALKVTPQHARFWHLMGLDQLLHQATYLGMVWYLPQAA